jgi:hypothetical protein
MDHLLEIVRGVLHRRQISQAAWSRSQQYDDCEKAYKAFDAMVRSNPASLELYAIEDGKEPKRLRRYELPRSVRYGRPALDYFR